MKAQKRIHELSRLVALVRDAELDQLAKHKAACDNLRSLLSQLGDYELPGTTCAVSELATEDLHKEWRAQRRRLLNQKLARATADYLDSHDRAVEAFGRATAIEAIAKNFRNPGGRYR